MEFIKRLLGYHKTPPVLVQACLFELNCVIRQIVPKHGRRVVQYIVDLFVVEQTVLANAELSFWKSVYSLLLPCLGRQGATNGGMRRTGERDNRKPCSNTGTFSISKAIF